MKRATYAGRHRVPYEARHSSGGYSLKSELARIAGDATASMTTPARRTLAVTLTAGGIVAAVAAPAYAVSIANGSGQHAVTGAGVDALQLAVSGLPQTGSVTPAVALSAPSVGSLPDVAGTFSAAPISASVAAPVTIAQIPYNGGAGSAFKTSTLSFDLPRANPRSAADAAAWAKAQAGHGGWYRQCLAFTANAYGWSMSGMATAMTQWDNTPASLRHEDDRQPPVGALLFWDTGHYAGHVAIYLGNGQVASNDIETPGQISVVPATDIEAKWGATYLGWTVPYYPAGV